MMADERYYQILEVGKQVTAEVTDQKKEVSKKQLHFVPRTPWNAQNIVSSEGWGRWLKPGESWDVFKAFRY